MPQQQYQEQEVDDQGNSVVMLQLERKSVQNFRDQDEYMYAMKEDLADWFNTLYQTQINVDNFFEEIETGVLMCTHANKTQHCILERIANDPDLPPDLKNSPINLPKNGVQFRSNAREGSFQSRDNISNFIAWCRGLGISDVLLFETEDLVTRKNERNVVLCLLEVARRGARYGMLAPQLIQLEEEIDAEIQGKEPPPQVQQVPRPRRMNDLMSLDEMVSTERFCTIF